MRGTWRLLTSVSFAWCVTSAYLVVLSYLLLAPRPLWFLFEERTENAIEAAVADGVQHALAYALLSLLLLWASREYSRWTIALIIFLACSHAIGTELLQTVIPGRFFSFGDGIADICGLLFGGCLSYIVRHLVHILAGSRPPAATRRNRLKRIDSIGEE